jgi:predicted dehydrogenase
LRKQSSRLQFRNPNIEIRNKFELSKRRNDQNETQPVELFRIFLLRHLVTPKAVPCSRFLSELSSSSSSSILLAFEDDFPADRSELAVFMSDRESSGVLRGAIIGFGEVARHGHWPAYTHSHDAKIVAIVDRTAERPKVTQASLPKVAVFSTIEELAASAEIDFVDICTPPALHGAPMLDALARGWNVLCEKPLLLDLAEIEKARSLARESGRAVVPVHNWKYAPIVRRATGMLRSGAIGPLREVEIETLRIQDCAVADPGRPNWRRDRAIAGGGVLMDHGWHAIYLARQWFREEPIDVRASLHRPATSDAEDEATVTLIFPRGGQAKIFLTWRAEVRRNTMRLIGERGEIAIDDDTLNAGGESIRFESALSAGSHHPDWFAAMLPDVVANFRSPETARESFEEAAFCLSVIRRAYQVSE